jgi:hypothetical protein
VAVDDALLGMVNIYFLLCRVKHDLTSALQVAVGRMHDYESSLLAIHYKLIDIASSLKEVSKAIGFLQAQPR